MNSSEQIRKALSAYFRDPSGTGQYAGSARSGAGETLSVGKDDMAHLKEISSRLSNEALNSKSSKITFK